MRTASVRRFSASRSLSAALLLAGTPADMVDVAKACPGVRIELRYATDKNGVGRAIYPAGAHCFLRRSVADRLRRAQARLTQSGLGLKVWDGYRPPSAQAALWAVKPDHRFVAPPGRGSRHSRGAAIDLTLVDRRGRELPMPSDFDSFTVRAKPDYKGGTAAQRQNRDRLRDAMTSVGFIPDRNEWWHFSAPDWQRYVMAEVPLTPPSGRKGHDAE